MVIKRRILAIALLSIYFGLSYKAVQYGVSLWSTHHILTLPGEGEIPFIPESFILYTSIYLVFPALFIFLPRDGHVAKTLLAFFVTSLIHYFIFLALPVRYVLRPNLVHAQDTLTQLIAGFYVIDGPFNNFPSMHVSLAFLCYFVTRRYLPRYGSLMFLLAIGIASSTVLVKQHYILDVLSAIPVAMLVNYFVLERLRVRNGIVAWEK